MTPAPSPTPVDPLLILPQVTASAGPYQWVIVVAALVALGALLFVLIFRAVKR
jgi:hypothetical protein